MPAYKKRFKKPFKPFNETCPFCDKGVSPDYKDFEELKKYVTDRQKIVSALRSGVCSRHQRELSIAVKRARHLALLPFVENIQ